MAKNIRKNKRLTKRRMNSSKKRLTKKRLTKRRMNLSKRKSRIKVSKKRLTKKRLTKKRLTTKRGGTVLLPNIVNTRGVAAKARQVVASAAENALLKLQIEPYRSWNETLVKFKKLPPPRSKLYYSALKEEITNMGTTEWFYHNLQPQSKVKYIEYLIEYIKRTIQDKGGSGDITQTELDEYWTHMTVDVSGHNVLNSSVLGWSVILGEVFNNNFEKSAAPGMLPSIVSATPSGTSSDASDLSSNTRYTRGPVAPSGASSGAPSVASSAAASGAPSVAPPLNKHQLRKGVKSILVNSGNGMLEKMCHDMRIDYTECDTFIQEIYAYTDRMFDSGIKDVGQIAEGFVDEIQREISRDGAGGEEGTGTASDASGVGEEGEEGEEGEDERTPLVLSGEIEKDKIGNELLAKFIQYYNTHWRATNPLAKVVAGQYKGIEQEFYKRLFNFDLKTFGHVIHDITELIDKETVHLSGGGRINEIIERILNMFVSVKEYIRKLYTKDPGARFTKTLHIDRAHNVVVPTAIDGVTYPVSVKKRKVDRYKLAIREYELIAMFMVGYGSYSQGLYNRGYIGDTDGYLPGLKDARNIGNSIKNLVVTNIAKYKVEIARKMRDEKMVATGAARAIREKGATDDTILEYVQLPDVCNNISATYKDPTVRETHRKNMLGFTSDGMWIKDILIDKPWI